VICPKSHTVQLISGRGGETDIAEPYFPVYTNFWKLYAPDHGINHDSAQYLSWRSEVHRYHSGYSRYVYGCLVHTALHYSPNRSRSTGNQAQSNQSLSTLLTIKRAQLTGMLRSKLYRMHMTRARIDIKPEIEYKVGTRLVDITIQNTSLDCSSMI
jgi:hypothetical protein